MNHKSILWFSTWLAVAATAFDSKASVRHVPSEYPTIQDAVNASENGDEILIAAGTYTGDGNRDIICYGLSLTFRGESDLGVIIDGSASDADLHRGFLCNSYERGLVFENLVITNCYTDSTMILSGAGAAMAFVGVSAVIRNCRIMSNCSSGGDYYMSSGAGLFAFQSEVTIDSCSILNNHNDAYGGAVALVDSDCSISSSVFDGNISNGSGSAVDLSGGTCHLTGCTLSNNQSDNGATLKSSSTKLALENCAFISNASLGHYADASALFDDGAVTTCFIRNCLFIDNQNDSSYYGEVITIYGNSVIQNCTFANNSSLGEVSVLENSYYSKTYLSNCIFWGNECPSEIDFFIRGELNLDHCDIQGGTSRILLEEDAVLNWGEGNIDADPMFTSGSSGDYYLSQTQAGQDADSLCVDTGNPSTAGWGFTRTDEVSDSGFSDLGFHYGFPNDSDQLFGSSIWLSRQNFRPGDGFGAIVQVDNWFPGNTGSDDLTSIQLFIVLHYLDAFFFWPDFTSTYNGAFLDLPWGSSSYLAAGWIDWPGGLGSGSAEWIAIAVDPENNSNIIGAWNVAAFEWEE
jgi:hypothetical protein